VTARKLADRLDALRDRVGPRDALMFYYAGHGHRRGAEGYLVPAGGRPERPETMLALSDVARRLRACDAHHTLMVLDCCFSGVALESGSGVERTVSEAGPMDGRLIGVRERDNLDRVLNRRAFQVITAGTGREPVGDVAQLSQGYAELGRSLPEYRGHSPFTAVLLQALRGLTGLPDGRQLASDLGYYMGSTLVSDERTNNRQVPRYGSLGGGDGDFIFFPAHPVINPRYLAAMFLDGPPYANLRESACRAVGQFLKEATVNRIGLIRSAVPHLGRLVGDIQPGPRLAAVATLAELAASTPADVPEFAELLPTLAKVATDDHQPPEIRRRAGQALGSLGSYASDEATLEAFRRHVGWLQEEWQVYKRQTAERLRVPADQFRLPIDWQSELDRQPVPAKPREAASLRERWGYSEGLRRYQEALSPLRLEEYVRRHQEGRAMLERAERLMEERDAGTARLLSARALGQVGFNGAPPEPAWLLPETPEWRAAAELPARVPAGTLLWSSPGVPEDDLKEERLNDFVHLSTSPPKYRDRIRCTALAASPDGSRVAAAGPADHTIRITDADGREVAALAGHSAPIRCLMYAPDGHSLALGSDDGTVRIWDPEARRVTAQLPGHGMSVDWVVLGSNGRVISGGRDESVRLWDAASGREVGRVRRAPIKASSPDGRWLAQSDFKTVRIWDWDSQSEVGRCDPAAAESGVTHLAFLPGGLMVADRTEVRVYGLRGGKPTRVLPLAGQPIRAVRVCAGGRVLALVMGSPARVIDPSTGEAVCTLRSFLPNVLEADFSADGKILAAAGADGVVRRWDVASGEAGPVPDRPGHVGPVISVRFAADGLSFESKGQHGTTRLWDIRTGRERPRPGSWEAADEGMAADAIAEVRRALDGEPRGDVRDGPPAVAATRDGVLAVVARRAPRQIEIWSVRPPRVEAILPPVGGGASTTLALSHDGRALAEGDAEGAVRIWDVPFRRLILVLRGHMSRVTDLAFVPDGRTLISAGADGTLRLWDVGGGRPLFRRSVGGAVTDLAFSPDGAMLASASPKARTAALRIWETASGREVRPLPGGSVRRMVFGPGGRSLVTADDRDRLVTWDLATRMPTLGPNPRIEDRGVGEHGAAFTADGRVYGTCTYYGTSRVIDVMTGKELGHHTLPVYFYGCALALAGGEKPLVASERGILNYATGELLGKLPGIDEIPCVVFSPDGQRVAGNGEDGSARVWKVLDSDPATRAPRPAMILPRVLEDAERDKFVHNASAPVRVLRGPSRCTAVAFAPNGRRLASGGVDGDVTIWDLETGLMVASLEGHTRAVRALRFAPDGRILASGGDDLTVALWAVPGTPDLGPSALTSRVAGLELIRTVPPPGGGPLPVNGPAGSHLSTTLWADRVPGRGLFEHYLRADNPEAAQSILKREGNPNPEDRRRLVATLCRQAATLLDRGAHSVASEVIKSAGSEMESDPELIYQAARLRAMTSTDAAAVAAELERAVRLGFRDWNRLIGDPALQPACATTHFRDHVELLFPPDVLIDRADEILRSAAGSPAEARRLCDGAVAKAPHDPKSLLKRAFARVRLKDLEEAESDARRAVEMRPDDPDVQYSLACVIALAASQLQGAARTGAIDRALDALERAVRCGFRARKHIENDPDLSLLHNNPRLRNIVDKL